MVEFLSNLEVTTPKKQWLLALRAGVEKEIQEAMQKITDHYCKNMRFTSKARQQAFVAEQCARSPMQALAFNWDWRAPLRGRQVGSQYLDILLLLIVENVKWHEKLNSDAEALKLMVRVAHFPLDAFVKSSPTRSVPSQIKTLISRLSRQRGLMLTEDQIAFLRLFIPNPSGAVAARLAPLMPDLTLSPPSFRHWQLDCAPFHLQKMYPE